MKKVKLYNIVCSEKIRMELLNIITNARNVVKRIDSHSHRNTHSLWSDVYVSVLSVRRSITEKVWTISKTKRESEF